MTQNPKAMKNQKHPRARSISSTQPRKGIVSIYIQILTVGELAPFWGKTIFTLSVTADVKLECLKRYY